MASDFQINTNEYLPLRDVVFNNLRQAILKGELKPGERLMEISLSNRLGVSRTPVREAMRMLEQEGLVIMIPRKGAQVAEITEQDLDDVLEVRLGLEQLAVGFACERITDGELEKLGRAAEKFEKTAQKKDLSAVAEADVAFHEVIYQATHNRRLVQMISNLREQMYRYRIEYLKDVEGRKTLAKEHQGIWEAMERGEKEDAIEKMTQHILRQQEGIRKNLKILGKKEAEKK